MQKRKKLDKKLILTRVAVLAVFLLIMLVGITILFYPNLSDYINKKNASRVLQGYQEAVVEMTPEDYSAYLEAARRYNQALFEGGYSARDAFGVDEQEEGDDDIYWSLLKIGEKGAMGYVTIDKINVSLPIYHGTSEVVLAVGAGHIHGSSLPVGGENTHSIISAHTGLPSATLFTNLDQLELGDSFVITVLGERFTYEVDQILVVLPEEIEALSIVPGEDYFTLVTCTPYGINSHRLLVRGTRIENAPELDVPVQRFSLETETSEGFFTKLANNIFTGFANLFEAFATLLVGIAEAVMRLFGIVF